MCDGLYFLLLLILLQLHSKSNYCGYYQYRPLFLCRFRYLYLFMRNVNKLKISESCREEVSGGSIWYRFDKITSEDRPLILVLATKERNQTKNQQCACADR